MSDLTHGFERLEMCLEAAQLADFTMHMAEMATKMHTYNSTVRPENMRHAEPFTKAEFVEFANVLADSYLVELFNEDLTPLAYSLMPQSGEDLMTVAKKQSFKAAQHYLGQKERMQDMRSMFVSSLQNQLGIGPNPATRRGSGWDIDLLSDGAYRWYPYEIQKQIMTKSFEKTKVRYYSSPRRWYHPEKGVIYFEKVN